MRRLLTFSTLCALLAASAVLADDNRLQAIELMPAARGADVVIRTAARPEFSVFRLKNPSRVVIDMPGVDVAGIAAPSPNDLVDAITTTQFRGRNGSVGRVVMVLAADADVDTAAQDRALVVHVRRATESPAKAAQANDTPVIELQGEGDSAPTVAGRLLDVVAKDQADGSLVLVRTNGQPGRYEVDQLEAPARVVVDLFDVDAPALERAFTGSAIKSAHVETSGNRTRIVLDGRGSSVPHFDVAATSEGLALMFNGASAARASGEVRGLSFDPKNGFWRLRFDVSGSVAVRTVKSARDEKVIALDGVRADASLLGTHRGGGAVGKIVVTKDPHRADSIRVALQLHEGAEDSVWQRDGALYWDVRSTSGAVAQAASARIQPAAAPFSSGPINLVQSGAPAVAYKGKKITIDLMDADIVNVIRLIGDVSGKNVVVGEEVKGKVTLKLKNVPWDQALDVVLKTKELGQETRGGIIRVVPQAKLDAEREARLKLQKEREEKLPTTVRLIPVNYAVASELVPQVEKLLSARGKATQDARTNVIIVEDIRDNLDQAERLVRTLDTQTPQVLIEARMVEGSTTFSRSLGIQWGGGLFFSQRGGNPTGLVFPNNVGLVGAADSVQGLGGAPTPGVFFPSNFAVNLPSQNVNSGIGLNLGSIGNFGFVNARLTAAEASGQAKIISSPRVTTLNNKRARISQGTDITVPLVTQNQLTVQTVKAALELDVTPHVTADGSILMTVNLTNNVPDFSQQVGQGVPPVSTKEAESEMLVKDGDTAVIGGIYTRNTAEGFSNTPFLGSIPIIGWLFKNVNESDTRTEMLVFITPRIVNRRTATPQGGGL